MDSSDVEREPCPYCGEPAALGGRICAHCRESLLVDLVLTRVPADSKSRYQAARTLSSLGPPIPGFPEVRIALQSGKGVLASGLTRAQARAASLAAEPQGLAFEIVSSPRSDPQAATPAPGPERHVLVLGGVALILALALAIVVPVLVSRRPRPEGQRNAGPATRASGGHGLRTEDLAERALDATVSISCKRSTGSGFFVTDELVLTNAHVLCPQGELLSVEVRGGRKLMGRVERRDDWLDVAVIRVPGAGARPLPLGDAQSLRPGTSVLVIGSPVGLQFSVARGIISHPARSVLGVSFIQFDANVNPGNSGGPLVDDQGRAAGIVSMRVTSASGLGLALPVNYAYEESPPFVSPPEPRPDAVAWRERLASLASDDLRDAAAVGATRLPGLSGAVALVNGEITAFVIRHAAEVPAAETLQFRLARAEGECRLAGAAGEWKRFTSQARGSASGARYVEWLARHGLTTDLYLASVPLDSSACASIDTAAGAELILEDGDPRSDRTVVKLFQ